MSKTEHLKVDEDTLYHMVLNGLQPAVRNCILQKNVHSLEELLQSANLYELAFDNDTGSNADIMKALAEMQKQLHNLQPTSVAPVRDEASTRRVTFQVPHEESQTQSHTPTQMHSCMHSDCMHPCGFSTAPELPFNCAMQRSFTQNRPQYQPRSFSPGPIQSFENPTYSNYRPNATQFNRILCLIRLTIALNQIVNCAVTAPAPTHLEGVLHTMSAVLNSIE